MSMLRDLRGIMVPPTPAAPPRQRVRVAPPPMMRHDPIAPPDAPAFRRRAPTPFAPAPEVQFAPGYLSTMLRRQDSIQEGSRTGTENVHVSSLQTFCARSYMLADQEGKLFDDKPTGGHRVMWKIGRAVEKHVRDNIIKDRDFQGILGQWRCLCGKMSHTGLHPGAAMKCEQCQQPLNVYGELTLLDPDAGVIGNPDLPIYVGDRVLPVEIKSMNAKAWEELKAPLPDHVFQVNSYRKLLHLAGYLLMPVNAVLYVTKDFKWGDPYKEFHITPDAVSGNIVEMAWADARKLKQARAAGHLPARTVCGAITDPRAKKCPVSATCFMRKG